MSEQQGQRLAVAVVGSGISGMAAAWLLSQEHDVTLYEQDRRLGGHSNTVTVERGAGPVAVDTGFIVYNELTYPNLTALLAHFRVETRPSDMSFAVSLDDGGLEYSGGGLAGLFAQRRNLVSARFWSMLRDLERFYRTAPGLLDGLDEEQTLGDVLDRGGYGPAFRDDHLLPMASAIWSASPNAMLDYPAAAFIRFHHNHGLLKLRDRPQWRTVAGGSRNYVAALTRDLAPRARLGSRVSKVLRTASGPRVIDAAGRAETFDQVVLATHADQALALLNQPSARERRLLGAFRYTRNRAVLHDDAGLMPVRRAVWSSWNFIGNRGAASELPTVTYWMNALQGIAPEVPLFVTLNPAREPVRTLHEEHYEHPLFDRAALSAQRQLWSLQGDAGIWYCGSYFGAGFHEDGLQSGLAVAEALGGMRRPWDVADESGRIVIGTRPVPALPGEIAA